MNIDFTHRLETRDIIIRQDVIDNSKTLTSNTGRLFPLLMIRDTVIHYSNIVSFEMIIGESFLPTINVTIDDEKYNFRDDDFIEGIDTCSVFLGVPDDIQYRPIKNEYVILSNNSSPEGSKITFSLELYVPLLYTYSSFSKECTSLEFIKELSKTLQLGFCSNITNTADKQIWIQRNDKTYKENVLDVVNRMYLSDNDRCEVFVDHYANLNIISLYNAVTGGAIENLLTDPQTGEALEETFPLIFTNSIYTETPVKIDRYTPINNYSEESKKVNTEFSVRDMYTIDESINDVSLSNDTQMSTGKVYITEHNDNTHVNYQKTQVLNKERVSLKQGMKIHSKLQYPLPAVYMFMFTQLEIYTYPKRTEITNNSEDIVMTDMESQVPVFESNREILNEKFSGNAYVEQIKYSFTKKKGMREYIIFNLI